ncbi:DUF938 domain-containing protein [Planctobacterium marinum]|uniref:Methylase n=1 Tax=Planctobacterium marinum TaxID=1631968 RepID=A0AA48KT65_9ALTE|nr:methylase [Planctobacterium marinum]
MQKRFSQACENNRLPILEQLQRLLKDSQQLLEIGSGTGQHASCFAPQLPNLLWHTSDVIQNHDSIIAWIQDTNAQNLKLPVTLRIGADPWPEGDFDAIYTANTAHIMQKDEVQLLMSLVAQHLPLGGVFCQYGPFTEKGQFSSESNLAFHQHLLSEGYGGYRDIDELRGWVAASGLQLSEVITMPANNLMLVWHKQ